MDEYIPQHPDAGSERQPQPEVKKEEDLITKAQAAPEAGPDLSAHSAQEQQAVLAFSSRIDLENAQQILESRRVRSKEHRRFFRHSAGQGQDRRSR